MKMSFDFITNFDEVRQEQLLDLFQSAWWTKTRSPEQVTKMVEHTAFNFGLVDTQEDQLVAYTRVLSDRVFKGLLFDVIVDPAYRGQGLGKMIVQKVLEQEAIQQLEVVELYCLPEHQSYYEQFGFRLMNEKFCFMRIGQQPEN